MTKRSDAWMPFYIGDYLKDTMHLTRDQHGAYCLLIMACWQRDGYLPLEPVQLAGMARATLAEWRKLAPVILPFFLNDGTRLSHKRVLAERQKAQRLTDARVATGQLGGRPRKPIGSGPETNRFSSPETNRLSLGSKHENLDETPSPSPEEEPAQQDVNRTDATGGKADVIPIGGRRK